MTCCVARYWLFRQFLPDDVVNMIFRIMICNQQEIYHIRNWVLLHGYKKQCICTNIGDLITRLVTRNYWSKIVDFVDSIGIGKVTQYVSSITIPFHVQSVVMGNVYVMNGKKIKPTVKLWLWCKWMLSAIQRDYDPDIIFDCSGVVIMNNNDRVAYIA